MRSAFRASLLLAILLSGIRLTAAADVGPPAAGPSRAPQRFGDGLSVAHVGAARFVRWQEGETTLFDLRDGVNVYQAADALHAQRALAWFSEAESNGRKFGILVVYVEKGASLLRAGRQERLDAPALMQLTAPSGLVLKGDLSVSGDMPALDGFITRAMTFRKAGESEEAARLRAGVMAGIVPSAEVITLTELTPSGAIVTLRGNADARWRDTALSADTIRIRVRLKESKFERVESIYAEGGVDLRRNGERITADSIILDLPMDEGLALNARVRILNLKQGPPVQFHADAVREISQYRFFTEGPGYVTTSQFAVPHFRIQGEQFELVRGVPPAPGETPSPAKEQVIASSRGNLLYLGPLPVLYWPYLAKDVRSSAFLIKSADVGSSNNLGTFARLSWNLYDLGIYMNDWSDLTLRTDYYSDRGFGLGLDFDYEQTARRGLVRSYYINDTGRLDDKGLPVPQHDRGELTWRHREMLSENWDGDLELGLVSDRNFLRTYDRKDLDEGKDHETTYFTRYYSGNELFTWGLQTRLNDFQNQTEKNAVGWHVIGAPLADTPALWTSHSEAAYLRRKLDESLDKSDPDGVARFDTNHELSLPTQLGVIRADPFIWGDLAAFSDRPDGGATGRFATAYGVRAASNFYKVSDVQSRIFDLDMLRHMVTPTVEYRNLWHTSTTPDDLTRNDETDALDKSHTLTLGVRNRWQTHREVDGERRQVDFVWFDLNYLAHLSDSGADRGQDDYLTASARWRVTEDVTLASEDDRYNIDRSRIDNLNGELSLDFWRPVRLSLIEKYFIDTVAGDDNPHSVSIFRIGYRPELSRWMVEFQTAYDFQSSKTPGAVKDPHKLGTALFFTRYMEGWQARIGTELNSGRANETILSFELLPPGYGKAQSETRGI